MLLLLGDDDDDDGGDGDEVEVDDERLLTVEMTLPLSSMVLECSVTIVVDRPRGYPPSAGTT